jgi:predicted dienelactone hydrolase
MNTCPTCNAEVIKATCSGQAVYLSPRKYARGPIAARQEDGGEWTAVLLLGAALSAPLAEGESRYSLHRCPGRDGALDAVRAAESKAAAKQRNERGRYKPRHQKGLRVGGVRLTAKGDHHER